LEKRNVGYVLPPPLCTVLCVFSFFSAPKETRCFFPPPFGSSRLLPLLLILDPRIFFRKALLISEDSTMPSSVAPKEEVSLLFLLRDTVRFQELAPPYEDFLFREHLRELDTSSFLKFRKRLPPPPLPSLPSLRGCSRVQAGFSNREVSKEPSPSPFFSSAWLRNSSFFSASQPSLGQARFRASLFPLHLIIGKVVRGDPPLSLWSPT